MPLAGVLHGFNRHEGGCAPAGIDGGASTFAAPERQSSPDPACHPKGCEEHDSASCPTCQTLLQIATSVVFEAPAASFVEVKPIIARDQPSRLVIANNPHATPFSRAPPAV